MQYVLLIYQGRAPLPTDPDAWATLSEEEQKAIYKDYGALNKTQGVSPGLTLGLPEDATTVQVKDGKPSHGRGRTSAKAQAATSCSRPTTSRPPSSWQHGSQPRVTAAPSRSVPSRRTGSADRPVILARPSRRCYPRRRLLVVVWIESPVLG
jgi:hypothetical protein